MKKTIAAILLGLISAIAFSQQRTVGDSLTVSFFRNCNLEVLQKRSDFKCSIVITNISGKNVTAYRELLYSRMPSLLANYDCPLYKKEDTGFKFVDHYSYEPPYQYLMDSLREIYPNEIADSIIRNFDFHKYILAPGKSDTLQFNLLCNNFYLDPGEYKFRIAFRIGNSSRKDETGTWRKDLLYAWSDWFYFKLDKKIVCSLSN